MQRCYEIKLICAGQKVGIPPTNQRVGYGPINKDDLNVS